MADFKFSTSAQDVTENLLRLHSYALGTPAERQFHFDRVYNAEHQVYYKTTEGPIFAPVKWCGAKDNSIGKYAVRKRKISQYYQRALFNIGFRPVSEGQPTYPEIYREFIDFCHEFGFKESAAGLPHSNSRPRKFWSLGYSPTPVLQNFSDEVSNPESYYEGATKTVSVNSYERNSKARLACIAHYGWACQACGIDFSEQYGDRGKEFIHVHHLRPLHEVGEEYEIDPVNDLRPICPNCHAMIHRKEPLLSIEDLSILLGSH
jgi:hypothetical protein